VAKFSKDYTRQAKWGMALSIVSTLGVLALIILLGRNLSGPDIVYGNKLYPTLVYLAGMATLAFATAGFWLGMQSWGEVRNEKQRCSTIGFFVGAIAICLTIIMLAFFFFRSQVVG
jgi:uncharacterized membrane protein